MHGGQFQLGGVRLHVLWRRRQRYVVHGAERKGLLRRAGFRRHQVQLPVLVVHGEHDVEQRKAAAEWLLSVLPQAEGARVAHAGHLPNLDNPREYEELLRQFLRRPSRVAA